MDFLVYRSMACQRVHFVGTRGAPQLPPADSPRLGRGGVGSKFDEQHIFAEWVRLVGKIVLDLVGVFCSHLGVPSGHIAQRIFCIGARFVLLPS